MRSFLYLLFGDHPSARDREALHLTGQTIELSRGIFYESRGDLIRSLPKIRQHLLGGEILAGVVTPEFALRELRYLDLPRGCLVVHRELMSTIRMHGGWRLYQEEIMGQYLVLKPLPEERRIERHITVAEDLRSFQNSLRSSTPTVIKVRLDEVQEAPHRWFGKLADPAVGGAVALMTLSAFRNHGSSHHQEIWLRNPAALGMRFSEDEDLLPSLVRNQSLEIHGLSVSLDDDKEKLLDIWKERLEGNNEISSETLLAELNHLDESGTLADYATFLTLRAPGEDPQVRIARGLVVEQVEPFVAQNLVIATDRKVIVNPGEIVPIALPAWCMNRDLPSPSGQEVRQTPFVLDLAGASDQGDVWSLLEERVLTSQP